MTLHDVMVIAMRAMAARGFMGMPIIVMMRRRRIGRAGVVRRRERKTTVDEEADERQHRNGPEPLGGGAAQWMRAGMRRGGCRFLQERKHQPFSRLMF